MLQKPISSAVGTDWLILLDKKDVKASLESMKPLAGETVIQKLASDFEAEAKEFTTLYMADGSGRRIFLAGLGDSKKPNDVREVVRSFIFKHRKKLNRHLNIELQEYSSLALPFADAPVEYASALTEGFYLGLYDVGLYKSDRKQDGYDVEAALLVPAQLEEAATAGQQRGKVVAECQIEAMDLVNMPGNKLYPEKLAHYALERAEKFGFKAEIWDEERLKIENMHAILAVGKGSERPSWFIILEYKPEKAEGLPKVALAGKGVTFDTGGISIKPANNMHFMKSDMGGAAAAIGAIEAAARLKLPVHLMAVVPAVENMPSGTAVIPGDVIDSHSGLTIEVENTDAEGRLILADALSWVNKNFNPDIMIDLATLTGACVMALGYHAAGMFTKNDALANQLSAAGEQSGEKVWRLPIWDEYAKQIRSDVADVKNLGGPAAGAITAAKFLEKFTANHTAWVHLDIAGTAFGDSEFSTMKSGTGFGVRLLTAFLEKELATTHY